MLSLLVLAAVACQQDPFDLNAPVQGTVRDEAGQPIARAKVQITAQWFMSDYTLALSSALWSQPLQPTFSSRDGTWTMPFTDAHRTIYGGGPGSFVLTVTAPGYQPWRESLVAGVNGFLGSSVVLHTPTAGESLELDLGPDRGGAIILVTLRIGNDSPVHSEFVVGADGKVTITAPRFPTPLIQQASRWLAAVTHTAQILQPGRSTAASSLQYGADGLRWQPGPVLRETRRVTVLTAGGETPQGIRGLYRCPDRRLRWFAAGQRELLADSALRIYAITATGQIADKTTRSQIRSAASELHLIPAPNNIRDLQLPVVDAEGNPIRDVHGYLWRLIDSDAVSYNRVQSRRPLARLVAQNGKLRFALRHLAKPSFLEIRAPGWDTKLIHEPRRLKDRTPIVLERASTGHLRLVVTDAGGDPLDDVFVFLNDNSLRAQPRPAGVMRTHDGGVLDVPHVTAGRRHMRIACEGFASHTEMYHVSKGEIVTAKVALERISPIRVLTLDTDDKPVPFVPMHLRSSAPTRSERRYLWSDSRGQLFLADTSVESAQINQQHLSGRGEAYNVDESEPTRFVAVAIDLLFVRTEGLRQGIRFVFDHDGGGGTTSKMGLVEGLLPLGYLIAWPPTRLDLRLGFGSGPPVRILPQDMRDADRLRPRLFELDRREIVRRQPIVVDGPAPDSLKFLRIEPVHFRDGIASSKIGSLVEVDASNRAFFVARDRAAWECRIMHPDFLPLEMKIDAADNDNAPIRIKLAKGTALSFRIRLTPSIAKGFDFTLRVRHRRGKKLAVLAEDQHRTPGRAGDIVTLRCPFALLPGPYTYDLHIAKSISVSKAVLLSPGRHQLVDLTRHAK